MKKISILGSTGSIGTQALDVINDCENYEVVALTANNNIDLLEKQIKKFNPQIVGVGDEEKARLLRERLDNNKVDIISGIEGLISAATVNCADMVLNSVVGMVGLIPTLEAIKSNKTIALANKETLVAGGEIVTRLAKEKKVQIIPVDSEHSAIFQCLASGKKEEIFKLILTASGGPFRGKNSKDLENVSLEDALAHPNWDMGRKISVDSATLMNKGLEVIEAKWLFDIDIEKIDVLVHPESIIHSMVEYIDGSVIGQLAVHDMRIPIQYALSYPKREFNSLNRLDLAEIGKLTFEKPDNKTFPSLTLAIQSSTIGGTMPAVLNAANEMVVNMFLQKRIMFKDIPKLIENVMNSHNVLYNPTLEDILQSDMWSRKQVQKLVELK